MTNIKYTINIFVFAVYVHGPEIRGCCFKQEGFSQVQDVGQPGVDDV